MTSLEIAFLVLVIASFALFMATLACVTWWSERGQKPVVTETRRAERPAPVAQDNRPGTAQGSVGRR